MPPPLLRRTLDEQIGGAKPCGGNTPPLAPLAPPWPPPRPPPQREGDYYASPRLQSSPTPPPHTPVPPSTHAPPPPPSPPPAPAPLALGPPARTRHRGTA